VFKEEDGLPKRWAVSSAALWPFIALLLGAIAAAVGGWIGAPREEIVAEAVVR
jgi:hypothetical protein